MKYINLTPRWTEILPTWLMMIEQAALGDCSNPDVVMQNAREEMRRMAEAADRFGDLVAALRAEGWADSAFNIALTRGLEIRECQRTLEHEADDTELERSNES